MLSFVSFQSSSAASENSETFLYPPDQRHLIPAIVDLRLYGKIPQEVYSQFDSRAIGESIVERVRRSEGARVAGPNDYDYLKDTEIGLYFDQALIEEIFKKGFLNQHQTGTTRSKSDPVWRSEVENTVAKAELEPAYQSGPTNPVNFIRPKYAAFDMTLVKKATGHYSYKTHGGIIAVMRPEVKYRATWKTSNIFMNPWSSHTVFYSSPLIAAPGEDYLAAIWGEVDLRDVQEFRVPADMPLDRLALLKAAGLPIYSYKEDKAKESDRLIRNKLLYAGNPEKVKKYKESLLKIRSQFGTTHVNYPFPPVNEGVLTEAEILAATSQGAQPEEAAVTPGFIGCIKTLLRSK